jgi:hypothetical protein
MVVVVVMVGRSTVVVAPSNEPPPQPGTVLSAEEMNAKALRAQRALAEARAKHDEQSFRSQLGEQAAAYLAIVGPAILLVVSFWLPRPDVRAMVLFAAPTFLAMLLLGPRWYGLLLLVPVACWPLLRSKSSVPEPSEA